MCLSARSKTRLNSLNIKVDSWHWRSQSWESPQSLLSKDKLIKRAPLASVCNFYYQLSCDDIVESTREGEKKNVDPEVRWYLSGSCFQSRVLKAHPKDFLKRISRKTTSTPFVVKLTLFFSKISTCPVFMCWHLNDTLPSCFCLSEQKAARHQPGFHLIVWHRIFYQKGVGIVNVNCLGFHEVVRAHKPH